MTTPLARARSVKLSGPPRAPMPGELWLERSGEEATVANYTALCTDNKPTSAVSAPRTLEAHRGPWPSR